MESEDFVEKVIFSRITTYGRKPKTAAQTLRQARDLLAEEGRWCQGDLFSDGDAEEVFEGATCGSWQACAVGAIGLVAGEMPVTIVKQTTEPEKHDWQDAVSFGETDLGWDEFRKTEVQVSYDWTEFIPDNSHDCPLTVDAVSVLAEYIREAEGFGYSYNDFQTVYTFNDQFADRSSVLEAFDGAIKLARKSK